MRLATHRPRGAALLAALVLVLGLAACGGDDDAPATTEEIPTATAQTEPGATETATEEETGTETEDEGTAEPAGPPFGSASASGPASGGGGGTPLLADVRLGRNAGFDRMVFEFRPGRGTPAYDVQYVQPPITTDPGGATMSVGGEAFLLVRMEPASGFDLTGDAGQTYRGPLRLSGADAGTELVVDLVRTGDFEAVLSWVAGLEREAAVRAFVLSGPPRLVVDVRTDGR